MKYSQTAATLNRKKSVGKTSDGNALSFIGNKDRSLSAWQRCKLIDSLVVDRSHIFRHALEWLLWDRMMYAVVGHNLPLGKLPLAKIKFAIKAAG